MTTNIEKLTNLGQSLWYDNIQRRLLESGEMQAMIARGEIRGVTSNPTIFNNAIAKSTDYDSALVPLAWAGWDAEKIFWELAVEDIRAACGLFLPLYEETNGGDGYVSIEVSPLLGHDTEASAAQAQQLWVRVARPNLMVKIPATPEGIPAIRRSIAAGLNINITLIFSLARYAEVMEAYLSGLEDRLSAGHPIERIASVASFFVSRVDTKVDPRLPEDSPLRGKAAIANAKLAYEQFRKTFAGARWEKLAARGARLQRPLWASTSTKNPAYPDTIYVDNLIGPDTVNTIPPQTLQALRDHAKIELSITRELGAAREALAQLESAGVSMAQVTQELEDEGVKSFSESFHALLETIDGRRKTAAASLGSLAGAVATRIAQLQADSVPTRLWARDPTLWTSDPVRKAEVRDRMGWLDSVQKAEKLLPAYLSFAEEIHKERTGRILVLGMGGSSLTAEVFSSLLAAQLLVPDATEQWAGDSCLSILDSTDPTQVAKAIIDYPAAQSLFIVASKSGGTAEVTAAFHLFWDLAKGDSSRFAAITDPATPLEKLARERGFRKIFSADKTVGGRYSALTDFGLVPAALLGMDLPRLLARADWMRQQCAADVPAARNPGLALGAVMAEFALAGRDKLTILADPPLTSLAGWIEQLVAESSGKDGKGILPVALEPLDDPKVYGNDRLFVYLRQTGELDDPVKRLRQAGESVLEFTVPDPYAATAEFFRWEVATAVACSVLGVNAFDQPDVQDSKDRTNAILAAYRQKHSLDEGRPVAEHDGIQIYAPQKVKGRNLSKILQWFVGQARAGDYVALNAYLPRNAWTAAPLQELRRLIRARTRCAVTAGFGPRFQHSTGQYHKGGPNTGLFLLITLESEPEIEIPEENMTFGLLERAQALGDYQALVARDRRVLRLHLPSTEYLTLLVEALR
jgi:transaldolase/glucose-6-phosphate isomerase